MIFFWKVMNKWLCYCSFWKAICCFLHWFICVWKGSCALCGQSYLYAICALMLMLVPCQTGSMSYKWHGTNISWFLFGSNIAHGLHIINLQMDYTITKFIQQVLEHFKVNPKWAIPTTYASKFLNAQCNIILDVGQSLLNKRYNIKIIHEQSNANWYFLSTARIFFFCLSTLDLYFSATFLHLSASFLLLSASILHLSAAVLYLSTSAEIFVPLYPRSTFKLSCHFLNLDRTRCLYTHISGSCHTK